MENVCTNLFFESLSRASFFLSDYYQSWNNSENNNEYYENIITIFFTYKMIVVFLPNNIFSNEKKRHIFMVNLMLKKDTCMKYIFIWNTPLPHKYIFYKIKNKQAKISTTLNKNFNSSKCLEGYDSEKCLLIWRLFLRGVFTSIYENQSLLS